jgi:hypothetical protein
MLIPAAQLPRLVPQVANQPNVKVLSQNWIWGQQFKEAAPGDRYLFEVPVNGSLVNDFIPRIRDAAKQAGQGGMVILFTGHGTRDPNDAVTDFHFEAIPEIVPADQTKTKLINDDVLNFLDRAQKNPQGRWVPKPYRRAGSSVQTTDSQATIDALAPKWAVIDAMRDEFKNSRVDRLVLLTCNLGKFPSQCQALANAIGTTVVAYRSAIASSLVVIDNPVSSMAMRTVALWARPSGSTNNHPPLVAADWVTSTAFSSTSTPDREAFLRANWKRHPYWTMIPIGPGLECRPLQRPAPF